MAVTVRNKLEVSLFMQQVNVQQIKDQRKVSVFLVCLVLSELKTELCGIWTELLQRFSHSHYAQLYYSHLPEGGEQIAHLSVCQYIGC